MGPIVVASSHKGADAVLFRGRLIRANSGVLTGDGTVHNGLDESVNPATRLTRVRAAAALVGTRRCCKELVRADVVAHQVDKLLGLAETIGAVTYHANTDAIVARWTTSDGIDGDEIHKQIRHLLNEMTDLANTCMAKIASLTERELARAEKRDPKAVANERLRRVGITAKNTTTVLRRVS